MNTEFQWKSNNVCRNWTNFQAQHVDIWNFHITKTKTRVRGRIWGGPLVSPNLGKHSIRARHVVAEEDRCLKLFTESTTLTAFASRALWFLQFRGLGDVKVCRSMESCCPLYWTRGLSFPPQDVWGFPHRLNLEQDCWHFESGEGFAKGGFGAVAVSGV